MILFRTIFPCFAALSACSTPTEQSRLIEEIERKVSLPGGAEAANRYVRFYAFADGGKVLARWVVPREGEAWPEDGCKEEVLTGNELDSREVSCDSLPAWPPGGVAGESRWLDRADDMPIRFDGGCSQINLLFDLRTRKVEQAFCNGRA
jgi:hypothetical protein